MSRLVFLLALFVFPVAPSPATASPNVVVILADDQGWGDLGLNGNNSLSTPHLDRLAARGVQLTNFYVQPVCSPTRAEFLTGRYYPRGGVYSTSAGGERLDAGEQTIADVFRQVGYATGAFGKWHNGTQAPYHPLNRGFDTFYGFTSGHWGSYFDALVDHDGEFTRSSGYLPDALTAQALAFIRRHAEARQPFFAYLALPTPHSPMQTTDAAWKKFHDRDVAPPARDALAQDLDHTRAALAMVENIDDNVGRVIDQLEALGIAENTLVVFFSDNGPNGHRWNGPMRGTKGSTDEGGTRSPLLLRWPGTLPAGATVDRLAGAIDLLPTLAALAGIDWTPARPLDGIDISASLLHPGSDFDDRALHHFWSGRHAVRTQRYRLDHEGQLYDIEADRGQRTALNASHPGLVRELGALRAAWIDDVGSGGADSRPLTVGYPGLAITQLPARDATWTGGIERSNQWPNDSYLTNWRSDSDTIDWAVEVGQAGRYRAAIWYTCPAQSTGVRITLSNGLSSTAAVITEAHDPPAYGMAHDRSPRKESYIKDFRTLPMGVLTLPAGRGTLSLGADGLTGPGPEFRLLLLEYLGPAHANNAAH